jgi:hypothetical protein
MVMNNVLIGDRVRWESAEGTIRGEVIGMHLARNAKNDLIPWLSIQYIRDNKTVKTTLCGLESYLKMMKFVVNFRDKE